MTARIEVTPPSRYAGQWAELAERLPHADPLTGLGLRDGDTVLAVVAHPDDETLGMGATLSSLAHSGVHVHVIAMTEGDGALDHVSRQVSGLGARRRAEFARACGTLSVDTWAIIGLPDGRLGDHRGEVASSIWADVERFAPRHLLTNWWGDPHRDHEAVGQAAVDMAARAGIAVTGFPIWAQHWCDPETFDPAAMSLEVISTNHHAEHLRQLALDYYVSQRAPLAADLDPILPPAVANWSTEFAIGTKGG